MRGIKIGKQKHRLQTEVVKPAALEKAGSTSVLHATLNEIKTIANVIGYIVRNSTSATIDFDDPSEIADYALFSSSMLTISKDIANLFQLGNVEGIIVEGKNAKLLYSTVADNRVSVFIEKGKDCGPILRKLSSIP